jgi:hypothetical protein
MALPTPVEMVQKFIKGVIYAFFGLLFVLVFSSGVQVAMFIAGAILLFFKHFVVGTGLMVVAIIARFTKKSVRLFR